MRRAPSLHGLTQRCAADGEEGTIGEGMLPKVHACLDALGGGVSKAHIIDGRISHAILLEVFTRTGIGTESQRNRSIHTHMLC